MLKTKAIVASDALRAWKQIAMGVAIAGAVGLTVVTKPLSYTAAIPAIRVWQAECFTSDCQPNRESASPPGIRNWVSWKTQDGGTGKLVLGPFDAPVSLSFGVVGYPNAPGNRLYVERVSTGELQEIKVAESESWQETEWPVPAAWQGHSIQLVDAYQQASLAQVADNRWRNLLMQLRGDYRGLVDPRSAGMSERRRDEFRYSFRAAGWWSLGWLLCPLAFVYSARQREAASFLQRWRQLALWAVSTFLVWIGLMFMPDAATIHQGSYAQQAMLFVLPAAMLARQSPGMLVGVVGLSVAVFMATWAPLPPWLEGYGYSFPAIVIAMAAWITALACSNPCCELASTAQSEGHLS